MTSTLICEEMENFGAPVAACALTELVKGTDCAFLEQMTPVVERQSVALDLERVERIDAAGIAALIALYRAARAAGNCFRIKNLQPRVSEMLALVGVQQILSSHNAGQAGKPTRALSRTAA